MRMVDLIEKKRDGFELTKEEIDFIIEGYTNGSIPDYQMSAFAMAVYFSGMNDVESTNLAIAMLNSGDAMDLSMIDGVKVDKHSTGGVGDKVSLVLAPMVASLGIKFAKMSGRGLGHTGGTLDKLESIPGFNIYLTYDEFVKQVNKIGLAIVGQTGNLTPADKKLYALRDVTATVNSIPLIASSIMSKKLASGSNAICLDVKVGSGAFMKDVDSATKLAELMVQIGKNAGRSMTAILTDMDEPLGCAIGNQLEVIEAINTLKGNGPKDLTDICLEIGSYLVLDAKVTDNLEEAKRLLKKQISNGEALNKLVELVKEQGGDETFILNTDKFITASEIIPVIATESGYVKYINALEVGISSMLLGGGRETMADIIDPAVGVVLVKKIDDFVNAGDVLAYIHSNGKNTQAALDRILNAYEIGDEIHNKQLILKVIR
jgi:pyrimidine-nucleoside phosphorylase